MDGGVRRYLLALLLKLLSKRLSFIIGRVFDPPLQKEVLFFIGNDKTSKNYYNNH